MAGTLNIAQLKATIDAALEQAAQHDLEREQALLEAHQRILAQQTQIADLTAKLDGTHPIEPPAAVAPTPTAVITRLPGLPIVGQPVHVHALDSILVGGDVLTHRYQWDFGDAGSKYNTLPGWNAAYAYDKPGTYTITLTVTDAQGRSGQSTLKLTIAPDTREVIRVGDDGDVKTLPEAMGQLADNTAILLRRGQVFEVSGGQGFAIGQTNVLIGAYGNGDAPVIKAVNWPTGGAIFNLSASANGITVQDLTFDSDQAHQTERTGTPVCITARGGNITVRNNTFLNVDHGINGNGRPAGVLMQNNRAPLDTGIRSYLAWIEGTDWVVLGNGIANSTRQHCVRMGRYDRVLLYANQLANLDRQAQGDRLDTIKTAFWAMEGEHAYFADNTVTGGVVRLGPSPGASDPAARARWIVVEHNDIRGSTVEILSGMEHLAVRDNTLVVANSANIVVGGYTASLDTSVDDIRILDNRATNTGTSGKFLAVMKDSSGITLIGNTYDARTMQTTAPDYAVISIADDNARAFAKVSGNTWIAKPVMTPRGTYIYVYPNKANGEAQWSSRGCWTPEQWNTATGGDDVFIDATKETK